MDRRTLVIGAAALAVAAGTRISPAGASTFGTATTSTIAHARQVLEQVNLDLGLVDPEGAQIRLMDSLAAYAASAPGDRLGDDVEAWTGRRVADLIGAGPLEAALDNPQILTLLAFGFMLITQHQDTQPPQMVRNMPVPTELAGLEPDFFPELLRQIGIRSRSTPAFAGLLRAGAAEVDRVVAKTKQDNPHWAGFLIFGFLLTAGPVLIGLLNKHMPNPPQN
jgi:hypothetical protein